MGAAVNTLYVSDLDGTLLRPNATLSDYSGRILLDLLQSGGLFSVASARSVVSMREILGDVPISLPTVGFNGGTINNWNTGATLRTACLESDVARHIVEATQRVDLSPFVSTDATVDRIRYTELVNAGMHWFLDERKAAGDPRLAHVDSFEPAYDEDVLCITVIADMDDLEPLHEGLERTVGGRTQPQLYLSPYGPKWSWLTFNGPTATKAHGIDTLIALAGLDSDTRVVVFGDAHNDIEMFARADYAIAPSNAHPDILAAADEVIGPNTEDAVARWLAANAI